MCSVLFEDALQQSGKHEIKHEWLSAHGVEVVRTRFDGAHAVPVSFGDYYREGSNIVVDTKRNVAEIAKNINGRGHDRFKRECVRAKSCGYKLVILVENNDGITCLRDLLTWRNDHCAACFDYRKGKCNPDDATTKCAKHGTRKPIQGARLAKAMSTMSVRYGVVFEFCRPHESAKRICELLGVKYDIE
jgi:ribosome-associated protein